MDKSVFNPEQQEQEISSKVVASLERISVVFKVLLWDKAKKLGLSPIQIQILIFIAYHKDEYCNVSHLAREFNITKPTISDAIKVLDKKRLIFKEYLESDNRRYNISLTDSGRKIVSKTKDFAEPLKTQVATFDDSELEDVFVTLSELIYKLNHIGVLSVQRTCYGCKHYEKHGAVDYCNLLQKKLLSDDIRIDCPEYEKK